MSGLLQRLAGQAIGAKAAGTSSNAARVRPAASVHSQVPVALPADSEPEPMLQAETPLTQSMLVERPVAGPPARSERETPRAIHQKTSPRPAAQAPSPALPPIGLVPRISPGDAIGLQPPETTRDFESRVPQALLGELLMGAPSPAIAPVSAPRIAVEVAAYRATSEPTEVHVHIGRIEVSAVQESGVPKKARTSAARRTLSLDEYLARRRST